MVRIKSLKLILLGAQDDGPYLYRIALRVSHHSVLQYFFIILKH